MTRVWNSTEARDHIALILAPVVGQASSTSISPARISRLILNAGSPVALRARRVVERKDSIVTP